MRRLFPILLVFLITCELSAQEKVDSSHVDSGYSISSAWEYLDQAIKSDNLWRPGSDSVRQALEGLLNHSKSPYDSVDLYLRARDFSTIDVNNGKAVITETLDVSWINDSSFVLDPLGWNKELYLKVEEHLQYPVERSMLLVSDSLAAGSLLSDSVIIIPDTIEITRIDTAALMDLGVRLFSYRDGLVSPPLRKAGSGKIAWLSDDKTKVYHALPRSTWLAEETSPFYILRHQQQLDSIQDAIDFLLDYNMQRDSSLLLIDDMFGHKTPYWLTGGRDETFRFWVKNFNNDSLSLWIGNPGRKQISLLMEDDVNFNRLLREEIDYLPLFLEKPRKNLKEITLLEPEPIYWDLAMSNMLGLSQTYLANWTKGGESSFSTIIDVSGEATYNNKDAKTQWINVGRLKYGTIMTTAKGWTKNTDQLEFDSKYNRNAWGKIGMSASLYMKTQLAKGFNYPNDSVATSKFLNPGTITLGLGAEYKPWEKTSLNVAPLSYKTTFVLDTANIDQTRHGIAENQKSRKELGLQVVFNSELKPFKEFTMINRMRFFSNYLDKPQNIDVDWEMVLEQKINWFFTVRLNLHLIYDDDVRFPVYDDNGDVIQLPDGSNREAAKPQFKEFLGLTLSFNI